MKKYLIALVAIAAVFMSCGKQHVEPADFTDQLIKIDQKELADGRLLTIYSADSLTTGYNPIYIRLTKGQGAYGSEIQLNTLMDMGTMKHSSPVVKPVYRSENEIYEAAAVFTMPSALKEWSLIVRLGDEEIVFPVNVRPAKTRTVASYTGTDGKVYILAVYPYDNFKVGLNNFSLFISRKESPMSFVPVDGLTVDFSPEMTSMGHSSPNNTNPGNRGGGIYTGKVNFTMTGDWRLHFTLKSGADTIVQDAYLDILF